MRMNSPLAGRARMSHPPWRAGRIILHPVSVLMRPCSKSSQMQSMIDMPLMSSGNSGSASCTIMHRAGDLRATAR